MRNSPHLHERHLMEAVRQKIISAEQMDAVMALSRTLTATGDGSPDLGWISVVHGLTATAALMIPAIYLLAQVDRWSSLWIATAAATCALACFGLARLSRRMGTGPVPESIFLAGIALFAMGVGASVFDAATGASFGHHPYEYGDTGDLLTMARSRAWIVGDLTMATAALILWRLKRVAPAGIPLGIALLHLPFTVLGLARVSLHMGGTLREHDGALVMLLAGGAMVAGAKAYERFNRSGADLSFWLMSVPLLPMGVAAMIRIDREAVEALVWLVVGVGVGLLGLRWNRRTLLAAGALAVLSFPVFGASEARFDETLVLTVLAASIAAVVVGATGLRRYYLERWMRAPEASSNERTAWM